jgi:rhodanese-related sulfurtransferase
MKKIILPVFILLFAACYGISFAGVIPVPITAEQAFDAIQTQTDPISGESTSVALVDVRSRAEYFWVGSACQVDKIVTTKGFSLAPDLGKAKLSGNGFHLIFHINGRPIRLHTAGISEIQLSPIALNIPYKLWDEETGTLFLNPDFVTTVNNLSSDYDVVIFFCRSGGRSEACLGDIDTSLFETIYEIDQPDGKSGRGGFEGTSYSDVYNGYRGFPRRFTGRQEHPSVSWKDAGLPIKTSINPLAE